MEAGHRRGRTDMTGAVARAIGDHMAAGAAVLSAAGARITRLASHAGSILGGNAAHARSAPADREAEYAETTEAFTPLSSRADWCDLVGRIPRPRAAAV